MSRAISVKDLSYAYGSTPVLHDLSFDVAGGGFFIILGPNGSGKTTLLKMLCGLETPPRGHVEILGRPLAKYGRRALARTVALVPQLLVLDFPFSVQEVILLGRTPHLGMIGIEQAEDLEIARQAMAFTEVDHLARRKVDQLSGGELQRVFIARAICQQPRIILLDEPTASLDLAHQVRVMDLMEKLKAEQDITVVMVSHDVNLAAMYADTLLLLKQGRIADQGPPEKVLNYKTLEDVYGCTVLVDESPLGASPRITPVPGRFMGAVKEEQ